MNAARYTVVMTACIAPPRAAEGLSITRFDPALRLADYEAALRFWLRLPDSRVDSIVFIDNSGYPLDSLAKIADQENPHRRKTELIGFKGNVIIPGISYGYSEFRLIDEGLARSRLYPAADRLIKATGRYQFPSISRLLDRLAPEIEVAADCRRIRGPGGQPRQFATAPLIVFSRTFFETSVRRLYLEMRPPPAHRKQFIEDVLYDAIAPLAGRPGVMLRWPVSCDPVGVGANGDDYRSPRKRLIQSARSLGRVLAPGWWF